jgi:N6-L-threonylcarbamoyladenine synthase/protein kinase Bud32
MAKKGNYIELPYVVKGMDLSFSGILTSALNKFRKGEKLEDLCYSMQETCYAMLTEVAERALAHTGKKELLLTGGVAASQRLQEMLEIMCRERGAKLYICPREFAGDNGVNIAWTGMLAYKNGQKPVSIEKADFYQRWRTDEVEIGWM